MNGATVGAAAALGLQLDNLLWGAVLAVLCLFGACLFGALIFGGLVIWDMLRSRRPAPEVDDSVRMLARWSDDDVIAELERTITEGEQDA